MDAAVDASEEAEVLLPEVVAAVARRPPRSLVLPAAGPLHRGHAPRRPRPGPGRAEPPGGGGRAPGRALGLPALTLQAASADRHLPALGVAGTSVTGRYRTHGEWNGMGPDATQPRVTVRPKPPVLLGATSTMTRWHRAGVVSDNPRPSRSRRLQGSHRDAPRTISDRILLPTPVTLPLRGSLPSLDPALQRSLGFPPFRLAASLRASLAPTLRCSLEVRRALVSELETGCASRRPRSMADSRNPDVLPIFLRVIPKWRRVHPQFFPMVRTRRGGRHRAAARCGARHGARRARAGRHLRARASRAPVRAPPTSPRSRPTQYLSTGALGAAAGDSRAGPAHALLRAPGARRPGGARLHHQLGSRPARPVHVRAGRPLLPVHLAGQGAPERAGALRDPGGPVGRPRPTRCPTRPPGPTPGVMWAPDVAQFGNHYLLYFTSQLQGVVAGHHVHRRRHQHRGRRPLHRLAGRPSSASSRSAAPSIPASSTTPTGSPT